ncbi:MAG TPA: aminoglycoside phosphotransferase family protein [Thermoanaerobaculia bacterium]|nr:aminoglycoside phosphotransferase family protein [Thermoanaerobaculia bacterium]
MFIPERLAASCRRSAEGRTWLERLPETIRDLEDRWCLSLEPPFAGSEGSCAWVAPVVRRDGGRAVLKLGMPHMEGAQELHGLCFWDGDPTVRLLEADADRNAMLLEVCEPGVALRHLPELEQDVVIARLLRRLWRRPAAQHPFRPLSAMIAHWAEETMAAAPRWTEAALLREGLRLFDELSRPSFDDVLLATDLHAGNVLSAQREPWLVIDPKPFVGDRAYDATQHLFNCKDRLLADPEATVRRFAELLDVGDERVRWWMFARAAAEPRDTWNDDTLMLARALA